MNLKLFGKNIVIYAIGNIALRASSFLLIPVYTYYLSVEDYGVLETAFVTIQILLIFMGLGMPSSVIRFYASSEESGDVQHLLGSSLVIVAIAMLVSSLLLVFFFGSFFSKLLQTESAHVLIVLICFTSLVQCLADYFMTIYRAQNKAGKYIFAALSNALLVILFTVLLLPLLRQGLNGALIARVLGYGLIGLILVFNVVRHTQLKFSMGKVREIFTFGFPLIFASSAWFIMEASDRYFIAYFVGMREVGIYGLGYKITFILLVLVIMPFQLAYGPFVFANMGHPDLKKTMSRLFTFLVLALVTVCYLIVLFSRDAISLMAPEEYKSAYLVTICILPASALTGIYYWTSSQLHIVKKTSYVAIVVVGASFLNLLLNYLLIPEYGWIGAAVATNISFLFAVGMLFILGYLCFPVPLEFRRLGIVAVILVIFCLSYMITNKLNVILYYGINCIILLITPIILYGIGFFDVQEKKFIQTLLTLKVIRR